MKTAGKAMGNHPGKYVIRETEYAATSFCGVDNNMLAHHGPSPAVSPLDMTLKML